MGEISQKKIQAHIELEGYESDSRGYKIGVTDFSCDFKIQTDPENDLLVKQALVDEIQRLLVEKFNAKKQ